MTQAELEALSRDELIALILAQATQIAALQQEIAALRARLDKPAAPPPTSRNSSQPPSRDQKPGQLVNRPKRKHGSKPGHVKHERPLVAQPDHLVELHAQHCSQCQADLTAVPPQLLAVNQMTELPPAPAEVIEVRQYARTCPQCGQVESPTVPEGLSLDRRFGARLAATVVYYRQEQHMSYERTQATMLALHGVRLSEGAIDDLMQRAGTGAAHQVTTTIQPTVQQSPVVNSDETGTRVDGQKAWHWVFCTVQAVLHVVKASRGADVIHKVMGPQVAEVWGSDCLPAQLRAPAQQWQLCLAHQLRNLQAVVDRYPTAFWAQAMQAVFRYALHLRNQRSQLSPDDYQAACLRLEWLCDGLLARPLAPPEARRLQKRYQQHRDHLFVFLYRADVPPTNNVSEQALRTAVVHRKVTGGFRSQWGAEAYAALASVIDTAALQGHNAFAALQALLGRPALPLPAIL